MGVSRQNSVTEYLDVVLGFCSEHEVCSAMRVSKAWCAGAQGEQLWAQLCRHRHGVVAKPATVSGWYEWFRIIANKVDFHSTREDLLAVVKNQGERMAHMDKQYANAMGTIRAMCDEQHTSRGTPRVLKGPRREEEEERDGISITAEGEVHIEEDRATFVDASYDEAFVMRRLSSSPTAAAVLSPCRVKLPSTRAASEPSLATFRQIHLTPERQVLMRPPPLHTPPKAVLQDKEEEAVEDEDIVEEQTETPAPATAATATTAATTAATTPVTPKGEAIRGSSPLPRVFEGRAAKHLQAPVDKPKPTAENEPAHEPTPVPELVPVSGHTQTRYMDKEAHEAYPAYPSTSSYPMHLESNDDVVQYCVEQLRYIVDVEKPNISDHFYQIVQRTGREATALLEMYNHEIYLGIRTKDHLKVNQHKYQKLIQKHLAVSSRLDESKRWVKKLKETIVENKVSTLPLHNKILKARMREEEAARDEAQAQADRFLAQRTQLFTELQESTNKVVAYEQAIKDMHQQHELALIKAAQNATAATEEATPSEPAAVPTENEDLKAENAALRANVDGLQALLQNVYVTNQELKQRCARETKSVEELVGQVQTVQQMYHNLMEESQQERYQWDQFEEKWVQHEEKYILQINALQRALQQQQQRTQQAPAVQQVVQP